MRKFEVYSLAMLLHHISHARHVIRPMVEDKDLSDQGMDQKDVDAWISGSIIHAQIISTQIGLDATHKRVWDGGGPFWMKSKTGITWREAYDELRVLAECVEADLEDKCFVFVLPEKALLLRNAKEEWGAIIQSIPDAKEDAREALSCYALERNTAAVFHLMRVAEWGLRAFCHHLGFKRVRSRIKKSGRLEFTPIEYSTWESILGQLRTKVTEKLSKLKRGSTKQQRQEFYNPILSEIEGFKDAWRNHVMHTRKNFNQEDARAIIVHVHRFMTLLVSNGVAEYDGS